MDRMTIKRQKGKRNSIRKPGIAAVLAAGIAASACGQDYNKLSPLHCTDYEYTERKQRTYHEKENGIQALETRRVDRCDGSKGITSESSEFFPAVRVHLRESDGPAFPQGRNVVEILGEERVVMTGGEYSVWLAKEGNRGFISPGESIEVHPDYRFVLESVTDTEARGRIEKKDGSYVFEPITLKTRNSASLIILENETGVRMKLYGVSGQEAHVAVLEGQREIMDGEAYQFSEGSFRFSFSTDSRGISGWRLQKI
ncbi:hypothetical protein GF318_05515 [Candidatus Micrarchaeota archaeon]|nr:hypothetical protein [Candidatus Micrarchaeota archaeon]